MTADGSSVLYPLGFGLNYGTTVHPEAVVFNDVVNRGNDTYTIPDVEGVVYTVDGKVMKAGSHPGKGEVTVVATAEDGYYLAWGEETTWSYTFEKVVPPRGKPSSLPTPNGDN